MKKKNIYYEVMCFPFKTNEGFNYASTTLEWQESVSAYGGNRRHKNGMKLEPDLKDLVSKLITTFTYFASSHFCLLLLYHYLR